MKWVVMAFIILLVIGMAILFMTWRIHNINDDIETCEKTGTGGVAIIERNGQLTCVDRKVVLYDTK